MRGEEGGAGDVFQEGQATGVPAGETCSKRYPAGQSKACGQTTAALHGRMPRADAAAQGACALDNS